MLNWILKDEEVFFIRMMWKRKEKRFLDEVRENEDYSINGYKLVSLDLVSGLKVGCIAFFGIGVGGEGNGRSSVRVFCFYFWV